MDMKQLQLRAGKRAEEAAAEIGVAISSVRNWEYLKSKNDSSEFKTANRCLPLYLSRASGGRDRNGTG